MTVHKRFIPIVWTDGQLSTVRVQNKSKQSTEWQENGGKPGAIAETASI
ncbi:hypothetical protein K9N68_08880 [Kovacikia minuta CCNUW1]|nr:hypothetical protein [Kovacikia minuta]UBF27992.1 hypothetical protein K9N68_08880 [Kovacikia minuta CCNUW1]